MFESSKDILNLLLGLSIALIAVVLAILLYQLIMIIRDFRNVSKSIRAKIDLLDEVLKTGKNILQTIQEKLEHSAAYFGILVELVNKIVGYMRSRQNQDDDSEKPDKRGEVESRSKNQELGQKNSKL